MLYLSELVGGKQRLRPVSCPGFARSADVVVCGVGTAGSLTALFCAQNGLSVIGVEDFTCVGGTHTAGGVMGHYFGNPGGRYEKIEDKVRQTAQRYTATVGECRKYVLEKALQEQGVQLVYGATVCGVYLQERTVVGLRIATDRGLEDIAAKVVLDCTAEAQVAVIAGCETRYGRSSDGQTQPFSIVSMVCKEGKYRYTNIDFGRVDQRDCAALSQAILFARAYEIPEGQDGKTLLAQLPLLGIREGRRIVAREVVSLEDVFADRQTKTPMFYSYADLDKHGWDIAFDGETLGDWAVGANLGAYNVTVAVPYQAIQPAGLEGILVPCRALGVDRDVASCVRMNLDMKKLAEAAAQWATLALREEIPLGQVSYDRLAGLLRQSGCLSDRDNRGYCIDGRRNWDGTPLVREQVHWITDPARLEQRLRTEMPGLGIWSARRMGEKALPVLRKLVLSEEENTAKHAAFSLAALGNAEGIRLLRDMVEQRDALMLKDCRKNNNLRGCMAIYWLGRLRDREITDPLIGLITDPREVDRPVYRPSGQRTTRYAIADYCDSYFQFMSQAVMALIRIGDAHGDLRPGISRAFEEAFLEDAYYRRITTRPIRSSEGNMVLAMKAIALGAVHRWQGDIQ